MRLAFFSPLNPDRSGISDYSEELLPYLAAHAEIDLVIRRDLQARPSIGDRFPVLGIDEFLARRERYDCVIYQVGNNLGFHGHMIECLRQAPGVVVLHDYSLSYLTLGLTLARGDLASLEKILEPAYKTKARQMAWKIALGRVDPYELSLARPVIEMSTGVIVHNRFSRDKLAAEYPGHRVGIVRHATPIRETLGDRVTLRQKYNLSKDDFLIVSVSRLAYNKRLDLAFRVLKRLVQSHASVRLIVVGEGYLGGRGERMIRDLGLENHILRTGWVSAEAYLDYIDLADAAIDLRYPTAGETSGGSLRLLQAGKPVVASAQGFFLELPADCCLSVPVNSHEELAIHDALLRLITNPDEARRIGAAARQFTLANLRREQAAEGYIRFIREVIDNPGPRPPAWELPKATISWPAVPVKLIHHAARLMQFSTQYGPATTIRKVFNSVRKADGTAP